MMYDKKYEVYFCYVLRLKFRGTYRNLRYQQNNLPFFGICRKIFQILCPPYFFEIDVSVE